MITFAFNEEYSKRFEAGEFSLVKVDQDGSTARVKLTFSSEDGEYIVLALHDPAPHGIAEGGKVPPLLGATLLSASVYSVYTFGRSKTKSAMFTCRSVAMIVPDGEEGQGLVLHGKRGPAAGAPRWSYGLFGDDGDGKAYVAPKEKSRAGTDALDLAGGAAFDMQSMAAMPWIPYSFGTGADGLFRAVFVQVDPTADENTPPPRLVLRVGDKEGSSAAAEALRKVAEPPEEKDGKDGGKAKAAKGDGKAKAGKDGARRKGAGSVRLAKAAEFLSVAAAAHEAGRMSISPESIKSGYVGVVDLYV